jgi:hypothetical protein
MALVEVARFHTLSEGHVAVSVLRSAGIMASVSDVHYGSVFWIEQRALGGYRLSVPAEDVADTLAILRAPPLPETPEDEDAVAPLPAGQRLLSGALLLTLGPAAGWLATKRTRGASLAEVAGGTVMAVILLLAFGGATSLGVFFVRQLLTDPG